MLGDNEMVPVMGVRFWPVSADGLPLLMTAARGT
jgi:hypothetical protein